MGPVPGVITGTYFQDSRLQRGVEYHYALAALNSIGEGPRSGHTAVVTKPGLVKELSARLDGDHVVLTWTPSPGATGYKLHRETLGGPGDEAVFDLTGSPAPTTYTDKGLSSGASYYYLLTAQNSSGPTAVVTGSSCEITVPGTLAKGPPFSPPAVSTAVPTVQAAGLSRQVVLSWPLAVSNLSVFRGTAPGAEVLVNAGLAGRTFTDTGLENGKKYFYKVGLPDASGTVKMSEEVSAVPTGASAEPWSGNLDFSLPGEPVQTCTLLIPDIKSPVRGVMLIEGRDEVNLPVLRKVSEAYNLAVIGFVNFNFGTGKSPLNISEPGDEIHPVMVMDFRWPELSARRLQAAMDAAAARFPQHQEISRAPVVLYGFSEAVMNTTLAGAQPAFAHRILAQIAVCMFGGSNFVPTDLVKSVPTLLVSAGKDDIFSSLGRLVLNSKSVTLDDYVRRMATKRGAPLTVLVDLEAGHGEHPDHPFIAQWLGDVLSQRLPGRIPDQGTAVLPDWNGVPSWAGTYDLNKYALVPWKYFFSPNVKLAKVAVAPLDQYRDPRPYIWLPSQNTALAWKDWAGKRAQP